MCFFTEITDSAQQTHYFNNAQISPTSKYEYDPLYRLIKATGRELNSLQMPTHIDIPNNIPLPNTAANAMQNYTHEFTYDELGNILQQKSLNQWTRDYYYDFKQNNYLLKDGKSEYLYDAFQRWKIMLPLII